MGERPGGWRRWATGVVTVGLVLLVVGWWRSEVARPEQEVLREFYRTEYGQLRRAWEGRAWEGVAGAESIGALVEEA